jgi:hypothetical protein
MYNFQSNYRNFHLLPEIVNLLTSKVVHVVQAVDRGRGKEEDKAIDEEEEEEESVCKFSTFY